MEQNIQELWGSYKRYNIRLTKILEGAEWGEEMRELFIVTIVETFPKVMLDNDS